MTRLLDALRNNPHWANKMTVNPLRADFHLSIHPLSRTQLQHATPNDDTPALDVKGLAKELISVDDDNQLTMGQDGLLYANLSVHLADNQLIDPLAHYILAKS